MMQEPFAFIEATCTEAACISVNFAVCLALQRSCFTSVYFSFNVANWFWYFSLFAIICSSNCLISSSPLCVPIAPHQTWFFVPQTSWWSLHTWSAMHFRLIPLWGMIDSLQGPLGFHWRTAIWRSPLWEDAWKCYVGLDSDIVGWQWFFLQGSKLE